MYSGCIGHFGPLMFLKQVYPKGIDLVNAVEVAVYACIREKICNFKAKPDGNNIFGSAGERITFLKDTNNKVMNPAQKPFRAIKQLLGAYTSPSDVVLDVFAGTRQVAHVAVELGLGSVSIEKDPIQVGFLKEFLQKEASDRIDTFASYNECNKCSKVIEAEENSKVCKGCGKRVYGECALSSSLDGAHFCSEICKNSVVE